MRKSVLIAASLACWPAAAWAQQSTPAATPMAPPAATPADDATKFVTGIIDKFNSGDAKAWVSAQADDTMIVDEFAPHTWTGAGSAKRWLDDYGKFSQTNGVTGGRVDYGKPLEATSDGSTAYVVLPTTYRFVAKGAKMAEPSNMTFVMKRGADGWKITSWTYSATGAAAPEK
jgi:ketosteroid isomerase-like protein